MRGKVKYTTKVKIQVNRMNLTLRTNQRRNAIKLGYEISSCRYDFWKTLLTGIQFIFKIM